MRNYSYLNFFDKVGNSLNFDYDQTTNSWTGSIFIPKVSTNLFGVAQIFIIEEFVNINGDTIYGFPEKINTGSTWNLEWQDIDPTAIFLFQFNQNAPDSFLTRYETIEVDLYDDPSAYENTDGMIVSDNPLSEALQVNIALSSPEENIFQRILKIYDSDKNVVLSCLIYGETEGIDPRLETLMNNFGYKVDESITPIFYDSELDEPLPNYITLNRKRKEMMLEGPSIYPYVGAYKALINIINFFGYPDLDIREYWKNIDINSDTYGKYKLGDPIKVGGPHDLNSLNVQVPQSILKKTNLFALTFKINDVLDTFDEYNLPETQENYQYSIEEALIKLYGLKRILQIDYLPLNARIKDIIGEASFFGKNELEYIPSQSQTQSYTNGINPQCEILPSNFVYLDDLRTVEDLTFAEFTPFNIEKNIWTGAGTSTGWLPNPSPGQENNPAGAPYPGSAYTLLDISEVLLGYFTNYADNYAKQVAGLIPRGRAGGPYEDKPGIPVGAPIILKNTSFENITWANANSTWAQLQTGQNLILDFEVDTTTGIIHTGDDYTITDTYSNTSITYTAQAGDNAQNIAQGLYTQWNLKIIAGDEPWKRFVISVQNTTSGYVLRAEGIGVDEIGYQYDFQPSTSSIFGTYATLKKEVIARGDLFLWSTIGYGDFYEIEWEIVKSSTAISPAYYHTVRGSLADYDSYPLILPYIGEYTVNLKLYDTFNGVSIGQEPCIVTVDSKVAEFSAYYRNFDPNASWSSQSSFTFGEYGSTWAVPVEPTVIWNEVDITYESLDYGSQIMLNTFLTMEDDFHLRNFQPSGNESFPGPYNWGNLIGPWNAMQQQWWNSTSVTGDQNASFRITFFTPGCNFYFSYGQQNVTVTLPYNVVTFKQLADYLNAETSNLVNRFIYNAVEDVNENVVFVLAVAKYEGEYGNVDVTCDTGDAIISDQSQGITYNATWADLKVINYGKELPKLSFVTFTYDKSLINGKDRPIWKITNNSNPNWEDIYFTSVYLTYLFKEAGNYTITLQLQDTNTNKYEFAKNMIIIK